MALILTQKLVRNGWPTDGPMQFVPEAQLTYSSGVIDDDNEHTEWYEYRLDGKVVKRGAHVTLKKNVLAEGIAAGLG